MIPGYSFRFCRHTYLFCAFAAWLALGVSTMAEESLRKHENHLRERMIQRAETYLNSVDQTAAPKVVPYASVVRRLIQAGFSADHPFVRSKIDTLLRISPRNRHEAARQREITLLRSLDRQTTFSPSQQDVSTIQAAVVSDHYNENFRRFGVVRLPRGSDSDRPHHPTTPNHETECLWVAVPGSSSASRHFEVAEIPESSLDSVFSSNGCRFVDTDRQSSFVLIVQTVRLRI